METFEPTGIQIHLINGRSHTFYQENPALVAQILEELDSKIFRTSSIVVSTSEDIICFPGDRVLGISVITDVLPQSLLIAEERAQTIVKQLSRETFQYRREQQMAKTEGIRNPMVWEVEFVSGEPLYLESSEIGANRARERDVLSHLFSRATLACRRLDRGFSLWNTAHIVSWSLYPKLDVPDTAWHAEPVGGSTGPLTEPVGLSF